MMFIRRRFENKLTFKTSGISSLIIIFQIFEKINQVILESSNERLCLFGWKLMHTYNHGDNAKSEGTDSLAIAVFV